MGQEVVGLVEKFEGGSGSEARIVGPDWKGGQDLAEGFDPIDHEADGNIGQRGSFAVGLVDAGKQPVQHLQQDLVRDVAQIGHFGRERVADEGTTGVTLRGAHRGGRDRASGLEGRVCPAQGKELVEDALEAPEVGLAPIASRALPLFDDRLDGHGGAGEVGDGHELRPGEARLRDLRLGRADEHSLRAQLLDQVGKA